MQKRDFMVYTHRKYGFNPIKIGRGVKLKHHIRETGSATLVASKKAMAKATLVKGIIVLYHSKFIVLQYV
jgi:hypothetical protein